jgi:hypothetical protein
MAYALRSANPIQFNISASKETTRTITVSIAPPPSPGMVTITLQNFTFAYSDGKQYGFGQMGIELGTVQSGSTWSATCVATLSDDKRDERKWQGSVTGMLYYYETLAT